MPQCHQQSISYVINRMFIDQSIENDKKLGPHVLNGTCTKILFYINTLYKMCFRQLAIFREDFLSLGQLTGFGLWQVLNLGRTPVSADCILLPVQTESS